MTLIKFQHTDSYGLTETIYINPEAVAAVYNRGSQCQVVLRNCNDAVYVDGDIDTVVSKLTEGKQ